MNDSSDQQQTLELSISLDPNGRTNFNFTQDNVDEDGHSNKKTKKESLDYRSKAVLLPTLEFKESEDSEKIIDELLFDCEVADCALLPRTFWVPSNGAPRCDLERMALDVFRHHVGIDNENNLQYDAELSGAEWWVQIRPSTKAGRYSVLLGDQNDQKDGICFHWDKDEELRLMTGMNIHPHISTVTYLTDIGAPTIAFNKRVDYTNGAHLHDDDDYSEKQSACCSWPKFGKHFSFDGRFLHAAPSEFMVPGAIESQIKFSQNHEIKSNVQSTLVRKHRRITFLVNIWINHRPIGVNPFPHSMLDKLSKDNIKKSIFEGYKPCQSINLSPGVETKEYTSFSWPLAGCEVTGQKESCLHTDIPLDGIRQEMRSGKTICINWTANNVKMASSPIIVEKEG